MRWLGFTLVLSLAPAAFAQSDRVFPDTKQNHWAYEALTRMRAENILAYSSPFIGQGGIASLRSEFAQRITLAATGLRDRVGMFDSQVKCVNKMIAGLESAPQTDTSLKQLKTDLLNVLHGGLGMKSYQEDLVDLQRLAKEFALDLAAQGVDLKHLSADLLAMDRRARRISVHKLPTA